MEELTGLIADGHLGLSAMVILDSTDVRCLINLARFLSISIFGHTYTGAAKVVEELYPYGAAIRYPQVFNPSGAIASKMTRDAATGSQDGSVPGCISRGD